MQRIKFNYKKEKKQNPFTGFTSFQHFGNDVLYSDLVVKPENNMTETEGVECYPVPEDVAEKGVLEGFYPQCSVAYIRILWKEFEPDRGEYRFDFIEDILKKAEQKGQTLMFRLMPHSTRESDDVPDWLKEVIDCPKRPKGERVKTSPASPEFLKFFGNAIKVFAKRFDESPTLAFVDVSLPGAWGEGCSCDLFSEEELKSFVDVYTDYFKNTKLIGQVCSPKLVNYMNEKSRVGWRADGIGNPWHMNVFVPQSNNAMSDVWKRGHISFESMWWLGEWYRKNWDIDKIISDTLSWHISTFNAKSLPIPFKWRDKVENWIAKMGYHFVIDEVAMPEKIRAGESAKIILKTENVGVAPIYSKIPLYLKFKAGETEKLIKTDVDITEWLPGENENEINFTLPEDIKEGECQLYIGIGDIYSYKVYFATDTYSEDNFYLIGDINTK